MIRKGVAHSFTMPRSPVTAFASFFMVIFVSCCLLPAPLFSHLHLGHEEGTRHGFAGEPLAPETAGHAREGVPERHSEDCPDCYFYAQVASGFEAAALFFFDHSVREAEAVPSPHQGADAAAPVRRWDSRAPPARI